MKKLFNDGDQVKVVGVESSELEGKIGSIIGWFSSDPIDMYIVLIDDQKILMLETYLELISIPTNNVLDN